MFRNPEYVKWANEETVHVFSYNLDPNQVKPEPMVDVDRGGTKASVFKAYPMFTAEEMEMLLGEIGKRVKYPLTTPWAGVLSPDGSKVLATVIKGGPKDFRAAYETEQKALGAPFPRADWLKIRASIEASSDAESDSAWKKSAESAVAARDAGKAAPAALKELIDARLASLTSAGRSLLDDAKKLKDPAAREKAVAQVLEDFRGLTILPDPVK